MIAQVRRHRRQGLPRRPRRRGRYAVDGVDVAVIYGPEYDMWLEGIDPELQAAMARAYNRWGAGDARDVGRAGDHVAAPVPLNDVGRARRGDPVRLRPPRHPVLLGPARTSSTVATSATATTTRSGSCCRTSTARSPPTSSWASTGTDGGPDRFDTFTEWHTVVHTLEAHGRAAVDDRPRRVRAVPPPAGARTWRPAAAGCRRGCTASTSTSRWPAQRVPRPHDVRHRVLQAQLLDLDRVRGPVRRRRHPVARRRPHPLRERLPASRLEVPAHDRALPRRCCPTRSPRRPSARSCGTTRSTSTASPMATCQRTSTRRPTPRWSPRPEMATFRRPHQAVDFAELERLFPPPPEYFESAWLDDPELIEQKQLTRLRARAQQTQRVPFFARRWAEAGFDSRDLQTLERPLKRPAYTVDDIRASIEAHPPYGDYQGVTPARRTTRADAHLHVGGHDRRVAAHPLHGVGSRGRSAAHRSSAVLQGIRPGDVVLNAWAYCTHNGAFSSTRRCTSGSTAS